MMKWLIAACAAMATTIAVARDYGQFANVLPEVRNWANGLVNKHGINCCSTADGLPAEIEYDTLGNHYRVFLEGAWYEVPDEAVLTEPNKAGYSMVWIARENGKIKIRCFIPGYLF